MLTHPPGRTSNRPPRPGSAVSRGRSRGLVTAPAAASTQQPDGGWQLDVAPSEPVRFYRFKLP